MKRKLKKTTKQYIVVALLCVLVIGGTATIAYLTMLNQMRNKYNALQEMAMQELEDNQRTVYVAKEGIEKGECITEENTEFLKVYATQPQETYLSANDIGKTVVINIEAGTHLISSMVTDNIVESDLREVSYQVINVNSNIVHNDTVDIRILFPNGENFVVLSKKLIKNESESIVEYFFWLTEEEIVRMSSAIVDAYLYQGTTLYTTKYIEPNLQEESIVTYTPSLATLELINNNPNILEIASNHLSSEVRKQLENRLALSNNTDVNKIDWDVKPQNNTNVENSNNVVSTDDDGFVYFTEEEIAKENDNEFGE